MFLDKGRDHDAAFLGRDTESLHAGSNCLLLSTAKKIECQPAADKPSQYAEPMCLFPRTEFERGNPIMRLLRLPSYKDFVGLKPTLWGIPQPGPDDHWEPFEDSGPLDLVIMPGVAFTTGGSRLGHGMGYYDRMLANHRTRFGKLPARYALALTQQIVDSVPLGSTDVPLDGLFPYKNLGILFTDWLKGFLNVIDMNIVNMNNATFMIMASNNPYVKFERNFQKKTDPMTRHFL
ncbi:hypothetical protein Y032_0048g1664 [Ancylostoma ceylanicum]|uniref:5-formyltetrahydrofolate cyclo-ligase n=1 Tax=Ancylostoma ceylanicum TaxID=53326 RepID=A0A016UA55_9BILA|nr:hypothetical protein Y032_0048g1664 [Ancylostoma ceylanicum]